MDELDHVPTRDRRASGGSRAEANPATSPAGRSRSRERRHRRKDRRRRRRSPSSSPEVKRKKASRWDATSTPEAVALGAAAAAALQPGARLPAPAQAALLLPAQGMATKKQRELYVGNLTANAMTGEGLRELFASLCAALPDFDGGRGPPVINAQLCEGGMFAFLEMQSEALASTMLKFHGLEVAGRPMKIGRPAGYLDPPHGAVPALAVPPEVLRELGISGLAGAHVTGAPMGAVIDARKRRELYVGNLTAGAVSGAMLRDAVNRVLAGALGGDDGGNPIVRHAEVQPGGMFAFVEFRDEPTATMALALLNGHDLCGRPLRVGRPAGYTDMGPEPLPTIAATPSYHPPPPSPPRALPPSVAYEPVDEPELLG